MAPRVLDTLSVAQPIDEVEAEVLMKRYRAGSITPANKVTSPIRSTPRSDTILGSKRAAISQIPQDNKRVKTAQPHKVPGTVRNVHPDRLRLLDTARPRSQATPKAASQSKDDATIGGRSTNPTLPMRAIPNTTSLQRAIRLQNDSSMDDQEYERILQLRRNERTIGVDRYVPAAAATSAPTQVAGTSSPLTGHNATTVLQAKTTKPVARKVGFPNLPERIRDKILRLALVRAQSIKLDFSWLIRNFIQSYTAIPASYDQVTLDNARYTIPRSMSRVKTDIQSMRARLGQDSNLQALLRHAHIYSRRLVPDGVNMALFHVSRDVHDRAARVFYGGNKFYFPSPEAGFMTLEAFLITIGTVNASYLGSLRVHAPLWHAGIGSDAIEGAMLDILSPATRFAVLKPPAEDRLLSAIETSTGILANAGNLKSLQLDLRYPEPARQFISQSAQTNLGLVRQEDAAAFVDRRRRGIEVLKQFSARLTTTPSSRPVIRILSLRPVNPPVAREFRFILASIIREAEKYGWGVDQILHDPASWKWVRALDRPVILW